MRRRAFQERKRVLMVPSDAQLVEATLDGSALAFDQLYERYQSPLVSFLTSRCQDADLAADITQDAFIRAFLQLQNLRDRTAFKPWLYMIGLRLLSNALRRCQCAPLASVANQPSTLQGSDRLAERCAEQELVHQALDSLSSTDHQILVLRHVHGATAREIANVLGTSRETAQRRINRAEQRFRQHVRRHDVLNTETSGTGTLQQRSA